MKHGRQQCNTECTTERGYFRALSRSNWTKHSLISKYESVFCHKQLCPAFLKSGSQSHFLCDDMLTSCANARCRIYSRHNALFNLEQLPLVPQETRGLDISPGLQSRGNSLNYLPNAQNSVINDFCVHAWQPGFTSQVQRRHWAHGESSVYPECVRFAAHTEPACLARLAHSSCQHHCTYPALCIWVLSCQATEDHLQGHHLYIQLTWGQQ